MAIESRNPYTGETAQRFDEPSEAGIVAAIGRSHQAFESWRRTPVAERARLMKRVAALLRGDSEAYALLPTVEMGKLLHESRGWEVQVCARIAEYYAEHAERLLAPRPLTLPDGRAAVHSEPIGPLLGVMPWNFPYYQAFRFVVPNLMAGNTCLIKHASNVPRCGIALEKLFRDAGFPEGVYTNLLISSGQAGLVIDDRRVRGISLTGSEAAGRKVAERAGRALKKVVLELGGSDPFVVLEDADLGLAVRMAAEGKMFNTGQACVAPKRFVVAKSLARDFVEGLRAELARLEPGDPRLPGTGYGPLSGPEAARELYGQIARSIALGARAVLGGSRPRGAFLAPTILTELRPGMPAYDDELFGPVAGILVAESEEHAVALANDTRFGLGAAVFTSDPERARRFASRLDVGMVFVNTFSISRPEVPFGGTKDSGFGRELAGLGIEEFLNRKLILEAGR